MRVRKGMHVRVCICERRHGEKKGKENEHSCAKAVRRGHLNQTHRR